MKNRSVLKIFTEKTSMRNKLWLGFIWVVGIIIATNLLIGVFITDVAVNRLWFTDIGLIMGLLLGYVISRYILKSVRNLLIATRAIGKGDLTKEVAISSKDEIGELAMSFNSMILSLREIILQVRKRSDDII